MKKLINYEGQIQNISCISCAREKGEITLGNIIKTKYFNAHQDFETPIPGFIIISSHRHIKSIDEFTSPEQLDFIKLLVRMRSALRQALNIKTVYLIQKEDTHHHFHIWLFPRYPWMIKQFGKNLKSMDPIILFARNNLKTQNNIVKIEKATAKLKSFLTNKK